MLTVGQKIHFVQFSEIMNLCPKKHKTVIQEHLWSVLCKQQEVCKVYT